MLISSTKKSSPDGLKLRAPGLRFERRFDAPEASGLPLAEPGMFEN